VVSALSEAWSEVVFEVGERDLGFHHPEFREVARRMRVLRPKRGTERVDLAHRQAIGLGVQLTGHGEKGLAAEEVVAIAVGGPVGDVQRADAEQVAGAFAIAGRDDRRIDPEEAVRIEVSVDGLRQGVAHPGHGTEGIGAGTEVGDGTQVLERVALLRDGVGIRFGHPAGDTDGVSLNFAALPPTLGSDDDACHFDSAPGGERSDFVVVGEFLVSHDLDRVEARTVVHVNEGKTAPRSTPGADPTSDGNGIANGDILVNNG